MKNIIVSFIVAIIMATFCGIIGNSWQVFKLVFVFEFLFVLMFLFVSNFIERNL